jgi:hypothetical protein
MKRRALKVGRGNYQDSVVEIQIRVTWPGMAALIGPSVQLGFPLA